VALAAVGMLTPQTLFAAPVAAPVITDVQLRDGGVLVGQLVDAQGNPAQGMPVSLRQNDRDVATTITDKSGYYNVSGLQGGIYQVASPNGSAAYRLWSPGTAPPSAQQGALLVVGDEIVRGQFGMWGFLTNPWVVAGLIATAIAVPIAVSNSGS
jgi:hypothetical protein